MSKLAGQVVRLLVTALLVPTFVFAQSGATKPQNATSRSAVTIEAAKGLAASSEILDEVAAMRQLRILHPVESGLKSRRDIEALVLKDMAESSTPREMQDASAMLRFLGLVPADFELEAQTVALLTEQIAGFYDPKTKNFYLADWIPLEEQRAVMAHELTHALTDQHFDLHRFSKWPDGDSDAGLAARALVEGDATALMIAFVLTEKRVPSDIAALPVSLTDALRDMISSTDDEHPVLNEAPEVLRQSLQFPYVYGAGFVQSLLREGSWDRVSQAYSKLPTSTEQIMHPEKYLSGEGPVAVALPDLTPLLGRKWRRADSDVSGEFGYFLILKEVLGDPKALQAAAGWGGDRYAFFLNDETGEATFVHESVWDDATEAQEFFSAYTERLRRRFGIRDLPGDTASRYEWRTSSGIVYVEIDGARVRVVEGYRGDDVRPLVARLREARRP